MNARLSALYRRMLRFLDNNEPQMCIDVDDVLALFRERRKLMEAVERAEKLISDELRPSSGEFLRQVVRDVAGET